ncbi:uncharacterized protein LOC114130554 isoform X3 [Aphis gossypii]|uniref:uncharacterized protein LOC114130554 isoform X3 n=1 Tax=Aphis gossypii TaxID=80765 RepID=UPI002158D791|nr:uncharacterized protein LOC114130554 isoform X3 [Aphis gossypii]
MGCVQSLFNNSSRSRSPSPENGFEMPMFETMPVAREPKRSYNTGISVADDRVHSDLEDDFDDRDMDDDDYIPNKCDDFDSYAMRDFQEPVKHRHVLAPRSMATLKKKAKCRSADASPANRRHRYRTSSPSHSASSSPHLGQRPPLIGSVSQPVLESRYVKATAVRKLACETGTIAVLSSTAEPLAEPADQCEWEEAERMQALHCSNHRDGWGATGPAAETFAVAGRWPMMAEGSGEETDLDRIPVGVIEVLDCEPADQCRPTPPKANLFPKAQRSSRDQHIPLPVIHAMEMKPNALGHDDRFKTVKVQPPSSDRHGYRSRMAAGSSTFDSSYRKPFVRQSNDLSRRDKKSAEDDEYEIIAGWMAKMPVFEKCPPAKSKSLPSKDPIARSTTTDEGMGDRQQGVLRGSSLPYDNGTEENSSKPDKRDDKEQVAIMVPISVEPTKIVVQADVHNISDGSKKTDMNDKPEDKPEENHKMDVVVKSLTDNESDMTEKLNAIHTADITEKPNATHAADMIEKPNATHTADTIEKPNVTHTADMTEKPNSTQTADKNKESDEDVQSDVKAKKELENMLIKDQKNEQHVEEICKNKENADGDAEKINSDDSKDQVPELETEYRLTMIHSVREAVNRICEQAVEKTAAIVRNRGFKRNSNASLISSLKDREAENSEAADNASSEFSLPPPPPPQQQPLDTSMLQGSIAQESSWPPPPTLSEAEEEKTIAPAGFSFDLPDPPTEMDQLDSETDKLDISDEEMRATGLPSDDDDKTDTEGGDGGAENDRSANKAVIIDAIMKSTANGGGSSSDGPVEEAIVVPQDNGADDRAATTIQAVYRGFRARKYVETVNAAAVKIQAGFRGYRVRQSLKNAAPSAAATTADDSQCWSDDDQKSVVSVIYTPLKEYDEPRSVGDGRGGGDDDDDNDRDVPSPAGVGGSDDGVVIGGGGGGVIGDGGNDDRSVKVASSVDGGRVAVGAGVGGIGGAIDAIYVDDDDDDELQTGDDEVFERDDNDKGGNVGLPMTVPTVTQQEPTIPTVTLQGPTIPTVTLQGLTIPTVTLQEPAIPIVTLQGPTIPTFTLQEPTSPPAESAPDDVAEAEALVQAAVKIQARVRGFATRKRLNEEKNDGGADKQQ